MRNKSTFIILVLCILLIATLSGCSMLGLGGDDEKEYKVIFVGTSIPSVTIEDGIITLPPNPTSEGYDFGGWFVDSECTIPFNQKYLSENPISGDIRLYPKWIEQGTNTAIITLNVNGGDELLNDEVVITKGMNVPQSLPVPTKGGCIFVGWFMHVDDGEEQMTDESGEITNYLGGDATFFASWEIATYDITVSSFDNSVGTASGSKIGADYLDNITVVATTLDDNYTFLGWFVGDERKSSEIEYSFEATENLSLVAKWIGEERTVNFYRNYMESDESFVEYTFNYGSEVNYVPARRAGYTFIGWYDNVSCVGDPISGNGVFEKMTLANNTNLYAGWSEGQEQLTYQQIGSTNAVKVTGVKATSGAIIHIPTEWCGYDVTTIGEGVFANSTKSAIVISSSITTIEEGAFSGAQATIYFDKGANLSLLNNTNFTSTQDIYTHLTLEADNALSDGDYVEANGMFADTIIDSKEEGRAFYGYCWLYTYDKPFTLTIADSVYDGNDDGFASAMTGSNGVFKNVNLELGLKSETETSYSISTIASERKITFTFSKKTSNPIASGYTEGGKLQQQSKSLIGISTAGSIHDFNIDSMPEYVVYNSEQLVYAVENGYKPVFGTSGTSAENCYNIARTALSTLVNEDMTNIEKVKAIHDYIALSVTYDSQLLLISTASGVDPSTISHYRGFNLEGVFEDGKAVCDGITKAFMLMCRIEGIEAIRVSGRSRSYNKEMGEYVEVGHAWNKVNVDGVWYTIDVTNDDSILKINETAYEVLNHQYFMVSDARIATSHIEDTYKEIPVSTGNYDYYANTLYDGERDLVITSQTELNIIIQKLKALVNETDTFYTIDVTVSGINASTLDFTNGLGGYAIVSVQFGNNTIYLVNFLKN